MSQSCSFTEVPCLKDVFSHPLDKVSEFSFDYLSPIAALLSLILIVAHLVNKKLLKSPGDLILAMSISDFLLSVNWLVLDRNPHFKFGCTCYYNGIYTIFISLVNFLYNICFMMYIYQKIQNVLRQARIYKPITLHIFTLSTSFLVTVILMIRNDIGQSLFGTCSKKFTCNGEYFPAFITFILYAAF